MVQGVLAIGHAFDLMHLHAFSKTGCDDRRSMPTSAKLVFMVFLGAAQNYPFRDRDLQR